VRLIPSDRLEVEGREVPPPNAPREAALRRLIRCNFEATEQLSSLRFRVLDDARVIELNHISEDGI